MSKPRGIEARLKWMRNNPPNKEGMCARTCWQALGGDYGNPPAWGAPNANSVYDKVIASGRYWKADDNDFPRGGLIVWKYGKNGHTALSEGKGKILTTDPYGRPGKTGTESITYPHRWGANRSKRIWTDQYNGVRFPVEEDDMPLSDDDIDRIARKVWMYEAPANSPDKKRTQKMLREIWEKVTGNKASAVSDEDE